MLNKYQWEAFDLLSSCGDAEFKCELTDDFLYVYHDKNQSINVPQSTSYWSVAERWYTDNGRKFSLSRAELVYLFKLGGFIPLEEDTPAEKIDPLFVCCTGIAENADGSRNVCYRAAFCQRSRSHKAAQIEGKTSSQEYIPASNCTKNGFYAFAIKTDSKVKDEDVNRFWISLRQFASDGAVALSYSKLTAYAYQLEAEKFEMKHQMINLEAENLVLRAKLEKLVLEAENAGKNQNNS